MTAADTMDSFASIVAVTGLALGGVGLALRGYRTARRARPPDRSPAKGVPERGVAYAFTLGMAPWAKESTRLHAFAYLRGVAFHVGIFLAMATLVLQALGARLPSSVALATAIVLVSCASLGFLGALDRIVQRNLRQLSTPDDHFAVWWVSLFVLLTGLTWLADTFRTPSYLVAGVLFAYIPLGKIRHCMYFFYSRMFFGRFVGRRGVLPHPSPAAPGGVR